MDEVIQWIESFNPSKLDYAKLHLACVTSDTAERVTLIGPLTFRCPTYAKSAEHTG